jgi:Mlc titration factor MtfA (ptsG expression regulator)
VFGFLQDWLDLNLLRRHPVKHTLWAQTLATVPILQGLSPIESSRLRKLAALFLARKTFFLAEDISLTTQQHLLIAAQACLPILNLDLSWYADWDTVVVFPGQFVRSRREIDSIGVMHEWQEVLRGEAWKRGPVVLSWPDAEGSGHGDGYNVIIHEMAHQIDMRNGPADGFPALHPTMTVADWRRAFTEAFQRLQVSIQRGEPTPLDAYAAKSPAEFFAVISEYFFELPAVVQATYPDVYVQLKAFYRQDPLQRRSVLKNDRSGAPFKTIE